MLRIIPWSDNSILKIIIIIISYSKLYNRFPWLSLSNHPYRPSLPAGLSDYILRPHRADVDKP